MTELDQIKRAEKAEREAAKYWEMLEEAKDKVRVLESDLENYKYVGPEKGLHQGPWA